MKFKCKWIYRRADHGNADTDSVWKTVDLQPQEISEGDGNRYKWGCSWQTKWQCPRGSDASKKLHIKGTVEDISPRHRKDAPSIFSHTARRQTLLICFLRFFLASLWNTLILSVSDILDYSVLCSHDIKIFFPVSVCVVTFSALPYCVKEGQLL